MNFSRTDDQKMVAELAATIFTGLLTRERRKELDQRDDPFDDALWRQLAAANLLGVAVAEDVGGTGHGFMELCSLLAAAGKAAAPVPLWASAMASVAIDQFAGPELRRSILPAAVRGDTVVTLALDEPDGADPYRPQTMARETGGRWQLRGIKTCVPAARRAAHIVVSAATDGGDAALFVIDAAGPGVSIEPQIATSGELQGLLRLASTPAELLGQVDGGGPLSWLLERATVGLCALELGVAEQVLAMTASYTSERTQFDRPIATFQAVAQRAADAYIDVEAIRLSMWEAAWRLSRDLPAARQVAIAKLVAAEGGQRVTYAAQHLHGGIGFDLDYPLARYYPFSKQIELTLGGAMTSLARLGASLAE